MIERAVIFDRLRRMRCGSCGCEWDVNANWLHQFDQGDEECPNCGTDCQVENRPDFWVPPDDPLFEDALVRSTYWYHTSTHSNWPDRAFDPASRLTDRTKQRFQRIRPDGRALERWAEGPQFT